MDTEHKSELRIQNSELRLKGTAIFFITNNGLALAKSLKKLYPNAYILKFKSGDVQQAWNKSGNLIFIMASGIAVRTIAPLIKDKRTDPAVVVLDEKGRYAVSLLSGHLGGANKIANEVAGFLGGKAVITTASDVNNHTAVDLWAGENNLAIENWNLLPKISTRLIDKGRLNVYVEQDSGVKLPMEFSAVKAPKDADVIITNKAGGLRGQVKPLKLFLRPKNLVMGIGCNSGTSAEEIESAVEKTLKKNKLSFLSIHSIATIDKKGSEPGLIAFAKKYNFKINTFTPDELNSIIFNLQPRLFGGQASTLSVRRASFNLSPAAYKATGAKGVAEPAALLSAGTDELLVPKQKIGNVTIAIAKQKSNPPLPPFVKGGRGGIFHQTPITRNSSLFIVGTGPGDIEHITPEAQRAIKESDVIVGYGTYLDLIKELIKDNDVVSTGMTQEIDRCKKAVELALSGKNVSVISGGDPGIYAMAGLVFEVLRGQGINKSTSHLNPGTLESLNPVVKVIPGISALNACAARLGAPLMHDFASISLSDRLTPWKLIEKRLKAAAMADFVMVLYNPKSKGRAEHIKKALEIILKHRNPETPVGIVKGAMRENEKIVITNLGNMLEHDIDMQTTVIIGNSQTYVWEKWMITPRGYEKKFKI